MSSSVFFYAFLLLAGTFISSVSQAMLKTAADKHYPSLIKEYTNPLVLGSYMIFIVSTLFSILAYRGIPLSLGPMLEATGYLYVTFFGVTLFREKFNSRKAAALALIFVGIAVYSFG